MLTVPIEILRNNLGNLFEQFYENLNAVKNMSRRNVESSVYVFKHWKEQITYKHSVNDENIWIIFSTFTMG